LGAYRDDLNPRDYTPYPGEFKSNEHLREIVYDMVEKGVKPKLVVVSPRRLTATQDWLADDRYRDDGSVFEEYADHPVVLTLDGEAYILDGHHRCSGALTANRKIKVYVFGGLMGVAENLNEASGYIPTAAEADDPRFEMALSVDIHPGSLGKAANSFLLNTDSQGHPQELRPDGLVQRMTEELALFKKKTSRLTENKLKFSRDKLDSLLNDLCEKVMKGQEEAPDFYGMVAAAVIDPKGRLATGINYLYGNQRIHAERAAIDNYEKKYGKLPSDCIIVTTLSPCNQDTGDIKEVTCTEVLNKKQIKIAYCGYMDPTQHRENNDFTILVTKNEKLNQMCKELADTFLKNKLDENTKHRHTEIFKYEHNGWIIYQNDHAAIRAATRQIGPIMQNGLLEATSNIHSLADKIPVGGDFWVQDIRTNSSLYFKRLDIPSEPQALRWETAVKDVPRASSKTPVFKVNAYTQPESPGDIAFMKKLKFAARFTGVDALAANLTQRAQKHKSDPDQIISDPEKQDSDRYNRAFKQTAQIKKTGVAEVKGIGINVYPAE
jgi:pyrimidine deaminase RibD-like protein